MNAEEQRIVVAEDGVLETPCEDCGGERNRDDRDGTAAAAISGDGLDGSEPVAAALNNNRVRTATPYQIFRNSTDMEDGGAALTVDARSGIVGVYDDDHFDLSDTEYDPIDDNEEEEDDDDDGSDKENEAPTISKRSNGNNNNSPSIEKLTATTPKKSSDATATDTTTTTRSGSGVLSPNSVEIRQNARKLLLRHRPRNKNAGRSNNNNIIHNRYRSAINDRNKKKKKRYSLPAFPVVGQPLLPLPSKDFSHNDNDNNNIISSSNNNNININPCIINGNNDKNTHGNNNPMSKEFHELTLLKKEQIESDLADMKNAASEAFESFSDAVSLGARSVWGQAIMGFNTSNGSGSGSGSGKKEQQQKENGNGNGGGRESSKGGGGVRVAEKNLVKAFGQGFIWD